MNEGLIPSRYAKALFEFAGENNADKRIYDMMHKLEPLTTAAGASTDDKVYARFLQLLVDNNRLAAMRDIALAYMKIYRREHKIYLVNVTSAAPFAPAEEERLKKLIERHLNGGTMEYNHSVDPDLIGGFVVNINNEKLDASIANELKQLRLKLLSK